MKGKQRKGEEGKEKGDHNDQLGIYATARCFKFVPLH